MEDVKKMICLYVITGFVYERDYCDCVISDVLEWHAGIDVEWGCVGLEILYKSVRWESSQVMTIYPFTQPISAPAVTHSTNLHGFVNL